MHRAQAKVILHSISPEGIPLTTMQCRYWHPIHAHSKTHRKMVVGDEVIEQVVDCSVMNDPNLSRNVGSSRARPSRAIIDQVRADPWGPIHWGKNQAGMQAREEMGEVSKGMCQAGWRTAAREAAMSANALLALGAHKQVVNRILEPYTYVDVLLTATDWANFFALRLHEDAQPEMQDLAKAIKDAMDASEPTLLQPGEWHLPYITDSDWGAAEEYLYGVGYTAAAVETPRVLEVLKRLSVSRCAKISYTAFDGTVEPIEKELERYSRLIESQPMHASPCEHQATPMESEWNDQHLQGNLRGWIQLRKTLPNEYVPG